MKSGSNHGKTRETLPPRLRLAVVATGDIWAGHEGDVGAIACRRAIIEIRQKSVGSRLTCHSNRPSQRDSHCRQNSLSRHTDACFRLSAEGE